MNEQTSAQEKLTHLVQSINDEIYLALGMKPDTWIRKLISPLVAKPTLRFSQIAVQFDQWIEKYGFSRAARFSLPNFAQKLLVTGAEFIPISGPTLIVSNHPGTMDSLTITANVPRDDIKIIAADIPFLKNLDNFHRHVLFVSRDAMHRMMAARNAIRHLRNGGLLVLFGSGTIDPDPAFMPDCDKAIEKWSQSIDLFVRKVPDLQIVLTIVSDVVQQSYMKHPFTWLRKTRIDRQRIAEFLQVIDLMTKPEKNCIQPRVSFQRFAWDENRMTQNESTIHAIVNQAKTLLSQHLHLEPTSWQTIQLAESSICEA